MQSKHGRTFHSLHARPFAASVPQADANTPFEPQRNGTQHSFHSHATQNATKAQRGFVPNLFSQRGRLHDLPTAKAGYAECQRLLKKHGDIAKKLVEADSPREEIDIMHERLENYSGLLQKHHTDFFPAFGTIKATWACTAYDSAKFQPERHRLFTLLESLCARIITSSMAMTVLSNGRNCREGYSILNSTRTTRTTYMNASFEMARGR